MLHARGRDSGRVAVALGAVGAAGIVLRAAGVRVELLALVLPLLATAVAATTLTPPDAQLESSAAVRWPRWRAVHLLVAAGAVIAACGPALAGAPGLTLRNALGFTGLAAAASVRARGEGAWIAPTAWCFAAAALGPQATGIAAIATWPVQPVGETAALAAALALAATGAAIHVLRPVLVRTRRARAPNLGAAGASPVP